MWGWLLSWVMSMAAAALCMAAAFKLVDILWWRPKRIEAHFARQGIGGPPYRFFIGNLREMVSLMLDASSKPMAPKNSHNILPRVLSFYHHWKKIYDCGEHMRLLRAAPAPHLNGTCSAA